MVQKLNSDREVALHAFETVAPLSLWFACSAGNFSILAMPRCRPSTVSWQEGPLSRSSRILALAVCGATLALSCSAASAGGPVIVIPKPGSGASSADASSWVAGGHAGYNWQQGTMV